LVAGAGVLDAACIVFAGWVAAVLYADESTLRAMADIAVLLLPLYMLAAIVLHAYEMQTLRRLSRALLSAFLALCISTAISMGLVFALKISETMSRAETGTTLMLLLFLLIATRIIGYGLLRRLLNSVIEQRVIIITDGVGIDPPVDDPMISTLNVRKRDITPQLSDPKFFDRMIGRLARDSDRIVMSFSDPEERRQWTQAMRLSGCNAEVAADIGEMQPIALSHWGSLPTLVISRGPLNAGERMVKRSFDVVMTSLMLVVFAPIIGIFALLVKMDSKGPAFFVQERVGRDNRPYRCFKLRTMRTDLLDLSGNVSTARDDPRVTRLGQFLRRSSIDELPQLFNVLNGDMSLVGPRPHALGSRAEGALFWELEPDYWGRHSMKPGVTGLAQVRGFRGTTHRREDLEQRVASDLEYINGWSLWLDIKIMLMTVRVVVHPNAY
jgi:exopolysaccharide biosynthesis polyprenyl glycosylphosphotransferase